MLGSSLIPKKPPLRIRFVRLRKCSIPILDLTADLRGLTPLGTGNLNTPDRATHVQRLIYPDERRCPLLDHPNFRIRGLSAYQRRNIPAMPPISTFIVKTVAL